MVTCWALPRVTAGRTGGHPGSYHDVEGGDHVEGGGEYGAHSFHGWLIQAVVGGQNLAVNTGDFTKPIPEKDTPSRLPAPRSPAQNPAPLFLPRNSELRQDFPTQGTGT